MSIFGGDRKPKPKPVPTPTALKTPTQQNGAFAGTQNYGGQAQLSNQSAIARGQFLSS